MLLFQGPFSASEVGLVPAFLAKIAHKSYCESHPNQSTRQRSSTVLCIQGCHRLVNGFLPYLSLEPWTKNVQPYIKKKMSIVFEKRRKTSCDSSVQLCMKKSEIGFILPCHSVLPTKSFHSKPFWQMSLAKLRAFFFQRLHKFTMFTVHNGTNVRIEEALRNTLAKI